MNLEIFMELSEEDQYKYFDELDLIEQSRFLLFYNPKPSKVYLGKYGGWISPKGEYYPAFQSGFHFTIPERLFGSTDHPRGWILIRLESIMDDILCYSNMLPTKKQIDTIFDWYLYDQRNREKLWNKFCKEYCFQGNKDG